MPVPLMLRWWRTAWCPLCRPAGIWYPWLPAPFLAWHMKCRLAGQEMQAVASPQPPVLMLTVGINPDPGSVPLQS